MTTSGRMVKWSTELSEYSLEFRPRQSIKAQALDDLIAECSFYSFENQEQQSAIGSRNCGVTPKKKLDLWTIYVDISSVQEDARAGYS